MNHGQIQKPLLAFIIGITLMGSLYLAVVDPSMRDEYLQISSASMGAFWGLQKPRRLG